MDLELPGGVITTHCVSTVIRPGSKVTHDPLQFVKIQSAELSKKAVEQIRLAEEVKITKDKIKEVEEEWQNNLLNWKSKRRQSRSMTNCSLGDEGEDEGLGLTHRHPNLSSHHLSHHHLNHHHPIHHRHLHHHESYGANQRKIKTFSEILNEKAKSGYRIGYNLHKYIRDGSEDDDEEEEEDEEDNCKLEDDTNSSSRLSSSSSDDASSKSKTNELSSTRTTNSQVNSPSSSSGCLTIKDNHDPEDNDDAKCDNNNEDDHEEVNDKNDGDDEAAPNDRSSSSSSSSSTTSSPPLDNTISSSGKREQSTNQDQAARPTVTPHTNSQLKMVNTKVISGIPCPLPLSRIVKPKGYSNLNTGSHNKTSICRVSSYNDQHNGSSSTASTGNRVILKYKVEKDLGRQSSLPLIHCDKSSSSPSSPPSSTQTGRTGPTENGNLSITVFSENEPRLSFRDKLSNFENLSKGEDTGSSCHPPHHANQYLPHTHHPAKELLKKKFSLDSNSTRISGEKARSEVQLIKKSNETFKSHHDQRSMLSISGKKKCSNCGDELGRGCAAMVIKTLSLYYHINCFRCSVCHIQLGNGTCGTDVRVRTNRLHCQNCYSNEVVGLTLG